MIPEHNLSGAENLVRLPVSTGLTPFGGFSLLNRHHYRHRKTLERWLRGRPPGAAVERSGSSEDGFETSRCGTPNGAWGGQPFG